MPLPVSGTRICRGMAMPCPKPNEKTESTSDDQRPTVGHRKLKPDRIQFSFLRTIGIVYRLY